MTTTVEIEIPEDERKDYEGMYEDVEDAVGEERLDSLIQENLGEALTRLLDGLYDQREQLAEQIQAEQ